MNNSPDAIPVVPNLSHNDNKVNFHLKMRDILKEGSTINYVDSSPQVPEKKRKLPMQPLAQQHQSSSPPLLTPSYIQNNMPIPKVKSQEQFPQLPALPQQVQPSASSQSPQHVQQSSSQQPPLAQQLQQNIIEPEVENDLDKSFSGMLYRNRFTIIIVLIIITVLLIIFILFCKNKFADAPPDIEEGKAKKMNTAGQPPPGGAVAQPIPQHQQSNQQQYQNQQSNQPLKNNDVVINIPPNPQMTPEMYQQYQQQRQLQLPLAQQQQHQLPLAQQQQQQYKQKMGQLTSQRNVKQVTPQGILPEMKEHEDLVSSTSEKDIDDVLNKVKQKETHSNSEDENEDGMADAVIDADDDDGSDNDAEEAEDMENEPVSIAAKAAIANANKKKMKLTSVKH